MNRKVPGVRIPSPPPGYFTRGHVGTSNGDTGTRHSAEGMRTPGGGRRSKAEALRRWAIRRIGTKSRSIAQPIPSPPPGYFTRGHVGTSNGDTGKTCRRSPPCLSRAPLAGRDATASRPFADAPANLHHSLSSLPSSTLSSTQPSILNPALDSLLYLSGSPFSGDASSALLRRHVFVFGAGVADLEVGHIDDLLRRRRLIGVETRTGAFFRHIPFGMVDAGL
jgi:hypothetical protein